MFIRINKDTNEISYPSDPWHNHHNVVPLDFTGGEVENYIYEQVNHTDVRQLEFDEYVEELFPEVVDGKWYQKFEIKKISAEDLEIKKQNFYNNVRERRNQLLELTDWTQMPDYNGALKPAWGEFRQQLRDLFNGELPHPDEFKFPAVPKLAKPLQPKFAEILEI